MAVQAAERGVKDLAARLAEAAAALAAVEQAEKESAAGGEADGKST